MSDVHHPLQCADTVSPGPPVQQKHLGKLLEPQWGRLPLRDSPFALQNGGVELQIGRPRCYAGGKFDKDNGARHGE